MRYVLLIASFSWSLLVTAQPRVLHFTRTSGFDHGTRSVSFTMFQSIGNELDVLVEDDANSSPFDDAAALALYDVIIFSNTSGNAILNETQRTNFEQWIANGGNVLGIHAANDTYRHSTANGSNTGTWDFYAELIGASVQENPNHVNGTPTYDMQRIGAHPSIYGLPDIWEKAEEYYYWENGYFGPGNTAVLLVEETVGPNGLVNTYDAIRPMSWHRTPAIGTRVFYTALGHAQENYTSDALFRVHMRDALAWLLDLSTGVEAVSRSQPSVFPNPTNDLLHIRMPSDQRDHAVTMHDATGRIVLQQYTDNPLMSIDTRALANGTYTIVVGNAGPRSVVILH